jgi:hypothetical protein
MMWIFGILIYWGNSSKLKKKKKKKNPLEPQVFPRMEDEQQKWVTKIFGYDYGIMYKKGKENVVVDTLS